MKNKIWLLGFVLFFSATAAFAQKNQEKKKIVIVTETIDKDGKKTVKKIVKDGKEAEEYIIKEGEGNGHISITIDDEGNIHNNKEVIIKKMGDDDIHIIKGHEGDYKNVNVNVNENDGEKEIEITIENEDGEKEVIKWKGDGEIPANIQEKMNLHRIQMHDMDNDENVFILQEDNKGFLGVKMGMEKTEEIENGVTTTSGSDEVEVLEVIEGSAAEEAGLKKGDLLKRVNGKDISEIEDVIDALEGTEAGDEVEVVYERAGQTETTTATLKEHQVVIISDDMEWIEMDEEEGEHVIKIERAGKGGTKIIKIEKEVIIDSDEDGKMEVIEISDEIPQVDFLEEIDIFPNPTDGILRVKFSADEKPTTIKVLDASGKIVFNKELEAFNGRFDEEINLKNAAKGALILNIEQEGEVFSEKIILK